MAECGTRAGRRDRVIAVVNPPGAADRLGDAELRALRVLADAGLVAPPPRPAAKDSAPTSAPQANPRTVIK